MVRFLFLLLLCFTLSPAFAEDKTDKAAEEETVEKEEAIEEEEEENLGYYSPEFCDFEVTFPEEPYTSQRCTRNKNGSKNCYNRTTYSMVYNLRTTLNIKVSCVPSTANKFDRFKGHVIRSALKGMARSANVQDSTINISETEETRKGVLNGSGPYSGQLWVGQNSILTVEATITGRPNREAKTVYNDVLRSIQEKTE